MSTEQISHKYRILDTPTLPNNAYTFAYSFRMHIEYFICIWKNIRRSIIYIQFKYGEPKENLQKKMFIYVNRIFYLMCVWLIANRHAYHKGNCIHFLNSFSREKPTSHAVQSTTHVKTNNVAKMSQLKKAILPS
jgi:hypothetical protein